MISRLLTVVIVFALVAAGLAGGYSFIQRYLEEQEWRRMSVTAEEHISARRLDEAISILRRVEARGGTARSTWLLGRALWDMNQRQPALEVFARLEERWPQSEFLADVLLYRARYAGEVLLDPEAARELFFQVAERFSNSPQAFAALVELARFNYEAGRVDEARRTLERIIRDTRGETRLEAELLLGHINMERLLSPIPSPEDEVYTIRRGDSLIRMSRQLRVPMELLQGINNLDARNLQVGRTIKVPRLQISLVVDRTERTLTVLNNERFLRKYRVGIPLDPRRLPTGNYSVVRKTNQGMDFLEVGVGTIRAGEPDNPYGPRIFITLTRDLAIHGTNNPEVVGTYTSRGLISMINAEAEELFRIVISGTRVTIQGEIRPNEAPIVR